MGCRDRLGLVGGFAGLQGRTKSRDPRQTSPNVILRRRTAWQGGITPPCTQGVRSCSVPDPHAIIAYPGVSPVLVGARARLAHYADGAAEATVTGHRLNLDDNAGLRRVDHHSAADVEAFATDSPRILRRAQALRRLTG